MCARATTKASCAAADALSGMLRTGKRPTCGSQRDKRSLSTRISKGKRTRHADKEFSTYNANAALSNVPYPRRHHKGHAGKIAGRREKENRRTYFKRTHLEPLHWRWSKAG